MQNLCRCFRSPLVPPLGVCRGGSDWRVPQLRSPPAAPQRSSFASCAGVKCGASSSSSSSETPLRAGERCRAGRCGFSDRCFTGAVLKPVYEGLFPSETSWFL